MRSKVETALEPSAPCRICAAAQREALDGAFGPFVITA